MTPHIPESPPATLRRLFARFWPELRRHRRAMALALVLVAIAPLAEAATIWVYKLAVDRVLVPRDLHALVWVGGLFAGLTLVSTIASFADDYACAWVGERFLLDLRTRVFRHLQTLSLDFFDRRSLGDLIARLTGDVAAIETLMGSGLTDALAYVLRIVFFSAALFLLQPVLALAALALAPLYWITSRRFSRTIKHASREKRRRSGAVSAVAEETLANVALTQAYTREDTEAERLDREGRHVFDAEMRTTWLRALFSTCVDVIEMVGVLVVIAIGTYELRAGHLTLGGLTAFLAYLTQLYSPVRRLSRLANSVFSASAGAERILELLDEHPRVTDRPDAVALERVHGRVSFEDVSFAYPEAARGALHDVSFDLRPGETLALVGASGAGKSTIAKLLLRFYDPASGSVRLDGHDLRDVRLADLRRHVALLLQETLILDGTVRENIAYGRPDATDEEIVAAATAAGAHEFVEHLDDGYDTRVGQRGRRLSGGQRQRVAIARAMIRDAPVLLLDEPTTGLDAETGRRILAPLRRLMAGRTTIVISHNLLTVRDADRIVVLDGGRVDECGTHDELLALDGLYARLWRLHQEPVLEVAA